MALIISLRRAAARVVPLAARVFKTSPRNSYPSSSSTLFATVNSGSFRLSSSRSALRYLSSLPASDEALKYEESDEPASDQALIQSLQDEILYEESHKKRVEELPPNFTFKLEDNHGRQTITLSKEYLGEQIIIEVQIPTTFIGGDNGDDLTSGDDADENGKPAPPQLTMVVRVSKSHGCYLEFCCTAEPNHIFIDRLSFKDPDRAEDQDQTYEGPYFLELDENLQKAFYKYLETRGVKPNTTSFLHEYMLNKDSREYYMWLNNIKNFVEA